MEQTAAIRIQATVEIASDGTYWCYSNASIGNAHLCGCGDSPEEAIEDMNVAYEEIKEMNDENGVTTPTVEFDYHFDIPAYFAHFDFLNVAKVAEHSGINASLLRRYACGKSKPGKEQMKRIRAALAKLVSELSSATV